VKDRLFILTGTSDEAQAFGEGIYASHDPVELAWRFKPNVKGPVVADFYGSQEHREKLEEAFRGEEIQALLVEQPVIDQFEAFLEQVLMTLMNVGLEELTQRIDVKQLAADLLGQQV
jgi:hypothetical protein